MSELYVVVSARYQIEVGSGYPEPMTVWKSSINVFRCASIEMFRTIQEEVQSGLKSEETSRMIWEMAFGKATCIPGMELVSKDGFAHLQFGGTGECLVISESMGSGECLEENDTLYPTL